MKKVEIHNKKTGLIHEAGLKIIMVGVIELESMTSTMSTWRSNQLSYTPGKTTGKSFNPSCMSSNISCILAFATAFTLKIEFFLQ